MRWSGELAAVLGFLVVFAMAYLMIMLITLRDQIESLDTYLRFGDLDDSHNDTPVG